MDSSAPQRKVEDILLPDTNRFVCYPIKYPEVFAMYKDALACFWTLEDIDLTTDVDDWANKLTDTTRQPFIKVLSFFALFDGIINENLVKNFCMEIQTFEHRAFYCFQTAIENVHGEVYSMLLRTFVTDLMEQQRLFDSVTTNSFIKAKADWALAHVNSLDLPFEDRLVAFACVEGIFFSASFLLIFWLKQKGLMPGLCLSNKLISRDEAMHTDFAVLVHNSLNNKCTRIHEIVDMAVELECAFVRDCLDVGMLGMTADGVCDYVKMIADRLLVSLKMERRYFKPNPYEWMERISTESKTNFFEKRNGDYTVAHKRGRFSIGNVF